MENKRSFKLLSIYSLSKIFLLRHLLNTGNNFYLIYFISKLIDNDVWVKEKIENNYKIKILNLLFNNLAIETKYNC